MSPGSQPRKKKSKFMQFQYRKIVFLTGAGISAESGLSLFRGKNGLWNNRNPEEVATAEALLQRCSDVLDFYNGLRHEMAEAKPNAAHLAISWLQQGYSGEVYILTQNMDTLHEKAGSENVYHIHGQINKIRCSHCHNVWETWNDITPDMPCPFCRAEKSLRPDIVFFGEEIMFTSVAEDLLRCADLFVAVGTSGEIPPASRFVWEAWKNGAKTLAFNLEPPANSVCFDRLVLGKADETLPEFIKNQFMTV